MMLAAVPMLLREAAAWVGAIGIVTAGVTAIFTRKPFKWLWGTLVSKPFGGWVQHQVTSSEIGASVLHHLGHNGDSVKLTDRVVRLERLALLQHGQNVIAYGRDDDIDLEED
jgi:hypothetical protein